MTANQLKRLLVLHRRLGIGLGILVLCWALTGVLHPIMSATQPQPVKRIPPPQQLFLEHALSVPSILKQQQIQQFSALQTIELSPQQIAYRILSAGQDKAEYYDSQTGQLIDNAEQQDAKRLAIWYTGLNKQNITSAQLITTFSDDYPSVNRLLPVWRVDFDNGLRAYVDPAQSRLATLSNNQKMWMAKIFRLGHTWTWGNQPWQGQSTVMQLSLVGILVMIFIGIGLFFKIKNRDNQRLKQKPLRFLHRYLGMSLSLFLIFWVLSGFYHIWQKKPEIVNTQPVFQARQLSEQAWQHAIKQPLQRLNLVPSDFNGSHVDAAWMLQLVGQPQLQGSMTAINEHQHHHNKTDLAPAIQLIDANTAKNLDVTAQAKRLTAHYLNLNVDQITEATWVTRFAGEYGFINKRLPVIKVATSLDNQLRLYIEPSSGVIAAQITEQDALEGLSFTYLHKWSWLPIDKTLRDIMLGTLAGLVALLTLLGFIVQIRKR